MRVQGTDKTKLGGEKVNETNKAKKADFLSYIKDRKSMALIIILLMLGLLLLILPGNTNKAKISDDEERLAKYTENLENKISALCSKVKGVSDVSVTLYFDSGFETIYAYDEQSKTTSSGLNSEKKYVTIGSGNDESMVCVLEKMPNICGVAIVCRGGGNSLVANELINLISSAFGVPKNKIYVTEGKK